MSGVYLIRSLRNKAKINRQTPILLISGFVEIAKEDSGIMENVIFLDKPFSQRQLLRYIQMCLGPVANELSK